MIEITQKIKDLTKEQLGSGDERVAQIQKEIKEYEKLHQGIMNMLLLVQRVQKEREDDMEKFRSEIQSIGEGYEKYAIYSEKIKGSVFRRKFCI